jgi:hypothetical protein
MKKVMKGAEERHPLWDILRDSNSPPTASKRKSKVMQVSRQMAACAAMTAILLGLSVGIAQAAAQAAKAPAPDLHAGGVQPNTIPNDATTEVTLPGFHLTGATVTSGEQCSVVSTKVESDNEIKMNIKGIRKVDDKDSQCTLTVQTPGGHASTWIVIELTEAEQQEQEAQQQAADMKAAQSFVQRSGKAWQLVFASGAKSSYTSNGVDADGAPIFQNSAGESVKILVANDNTVMIIESSCMRSGKLAGNQVKNGVSQGECTPAGPWTATVSQ